MNHLSAKSVLLSPPKLVRNGGHYFPGVPSISGEKGETVTLPGIAVTEEEAVNEIYLAFEKVIDRGGIGLVGCGGCLGGGGGEDEQKKRRLWRNEFLVRGPSQDSGFCDGGTVWLVRNGAMFSEGIAEFREKTHIVFKETFFGVMWKILPLSDIVFNEVYDGCFTKNHDFIMDHMDLVNQPEQFGGFLDVTKETRGYILWTTFA